MDDNKYLHAVIIQVFNYKITKLFWLFSEIDYNNVKNLIDYSNFDVITKLLMKQEFSYFLVYQEIKKIFYVL